MKINYSVTATFKGLLRDISLGEWCRGSCWVLLGIPTALPPPLCPQHPGMVTMPWAWQHGREAST